MSEKDDAYWLELVKELPLKGLAKQIVYHVAPMPTLDENVFGLAYEPGGLVELSLTPRVTAQINAAFAEVMDDKLKVVFMPLSGCRNRTAAFILESRGRVH